MAELERKIDREQIRLIYNQGPVLVAGATLCAFFITAFLWRESPHSTLIVWLVAISFSTILRLFCMLLSLVL